MDKGSLGFSTQATLARTSEKGESGDEVRKKKESEDRLSYKQNRAYDSIQGEELRPGENDFFPLFLQ